MDLNERAGVINDGIDLWDEPELNKSIAFTVWKLNQAWARARSADVRSRRMVNAFVVSLDLVFWAAVKNLANRKRADD